ncbi:MAG: hypothetical protein FJ288_02945 [Planctomycetes bacterium]|nr:hypothetical protein [Planctomycetota bacterium]
MPSDPDFERYLQKRAEALGLPTDPEAYRDGGLAEAALFTNMSEAETLVALLRGEDIPAWVKSPLSTLAAAAPVTEYGVLVPLGRLADARKLIAEHEGHAPAPEEAEEPQAETAAEMQPPQTAGETEQPAPRRPLRRTMVGIFFLVVGLLYLATTAAVVMQETGRGLSTEAIAEAAFGGGLTAICLVVGVIALRSPRCNK